MRARFVSSRLGVFSILGAIALVLLTALTGNADAVDPSVIQDQAAIPVGISDQSSVSQSLVAHRDRLHALQVRWIVPEDFKPAPNGVVTLHLRERPDGADLATASLALSELRNNEYGKFVFASIANSDGRMFYFSLDIPSSSIERGSVAVWASDDDALASGQLSVNGMATPGDLVLRAYYEPDAATLLSALARAAERYGKGLLVVLLLGGLVGLAILAGAQALSLPTLVITGLAALSGAGVLLLVFKLNPLLLPSAAIILAGLGVIRWARGGRGKWRLAREGWLWALLALGSLVVGLEQIRDTEVPLWVDSFTHAQIIQSLLSQGQLPASSFYHLGFHTVTALVAQIAGMNIPAAMLLMGPVLITLGGLSVAMLCRRLTGSSAAALVSAIAVWFLSPTPSYFTTWGRYPLLLGAVLLPAALVAFMDWIEDERANAWSALATSVLLGGLAFAQMRLVIFYLAFVAVYLAAPRISGTFRVQWKRLLPPLLAVVVFAALWVGAVLLRGLSLASLLAENTSGPSIDMGTVVAVVMTHHGPELLVLAALSAVLTLVRRSRTTALVLAWYALLALVAFIPRSERVGSLISPDLVALMGFVPVALVIGEASGWVWPRLVSSGTRWQKAAWGFAVALIVLIGARDMVSVVNPATVTYAEADSRAFDWIRTQAPDHAPFLVNSFNWYDESYAPSDGGTWIPFLEDRPIAYLTPPDAGLAARADAVADWMQARDIAYVYVGWKGGILNGTEFECSLRFTRVYARDGVAIFRLTANENPLAPQVLPPNCSLHG